MPEQPDNGVTLCDRCGKPDGLCMCDGIEPVDNRIGVLILQHPQEQDIALGTARLTKLHLTRATLKVGLSWPSLSQAMGRQVNPHTWGVVYLGSAKAASILPDREIVVTDRNARPVSNQDAALATIKGVVLLDGTWSQAKTLWWRNPWMLKSPRLILGPKRPSHYGKLRKEPRRDGLSTIEATGLVLAGLEKRPEIATRLTAGFDRLLDRYRATQGGEAAGRASTGGVAPAVS